MDSSLPKNDKPIIDLKLWKSIGRLIDSLNSIDKLPRKIGKLDDAIVWLVDGDQVRYDYYMDFVYAGNDFAYKTLSPNTIPNGQIWLDGHIDKHEMKLSLYHEVTERRLMQNGMKYNKAHKIANLSEKKLFDRHAKVEHNGYPAESTMQIAGIITDL